MFRAAASVLASALLALTALVSAADNPPGSDKAKADPAPVAGNWKLSIPAIGGGRPLWLVKLTEKDGKWVGELTKSEDVPPTSIDKVAVNGDVLTFNLVIGDEKPPAGKPPADKPEDKPVAFLFEIKIPKAAGDKLQGTVLLPNKTLQPVQLEKTTLSSLDSFEVGKEVLTKHPDAPEAVRAGLDLIQMAKAKKATKDDVKNWADLTLKAADRFGPRYQKYVIGRLAELLGSEADFAELGVEYANKAAKLLTPKDKGNEQRRVLQLLQTALESAGKKDEAKAIEEKIKKIDLTLKPEPFAGRKGKSDRVVLVELFTGAQCPPCVAADMAFDALGKAYKPSEVVLLEYHLHVPAPDPLANEETDERANFYGRVISGTPTILINGTVGPEGGGSAEDAEEKYDDFAATINPLLEQAGELKLKATATRKDGKIDVQAEVNAPAKPEDRLKLRLVLVEDKVEYVGSNAVAEHHHVVRAFPGGTDGFTVKDKTLKQSATVDLDELKKDLQKGLKKTLDKWTEKNPKRKIPEGQPLEFKNLKLVAFVQNQETHEIVQAIEVDVKDAK